MGVQIPVGFGIAKLRWKILTQPDEQIVTIGYAHTVTNTAQDDADDIYAAAAASPGPLNQGKYSTKYQRVGVEVTHVDALGPHTAEHVDRLTGTGTGTPLTSNTSVLVRKETALGGRHGRGRMFVPGIQVSEIDVDESGLIGTTDLTAIQVTWTAFFDAMVASTCLPVLLHADGSTPNAITALRVQPIVATQRRRMRR
jgi:hypothetical protein